MIVALFKLLLLLLLGSLASVLKLPNVLPDGFINVVNGFFGDLLILGEFGTRRGETGIRIGPNCLNSLTSLFVVVPVKGASL